MDINTKEKKVYHGQKIDRKAYFMKKKIIVIGIFLISLITFIFVYRYYNKEDKTTTLTVSEKRWLENNIDQEYDFEIVNDYPLYGLNGNGVIYDFIDDFQKNIGIEFNIISYLKTSSPTTNSYRVRILNEDEKMTLRLCHENPDIISIYEKYLEKPNSDIAKELLHREFFDKSDMVYK